MTTLSDIPSIVYLNRAFLPLADAKISVMDRGFLFGDGVYEVVPVYGGQPYLADEHLDRLTHSLESIQLDLKMDKQAWMDIFNTLLEKNAHFGEEQVIYLQVTRGVPEARDHLFPETFVEPTVFAQTTPLKRKSEEEIEAGFSAITLEDTRWMHCHIKSTSLLANVLLLQQAKSQGALEAILLRDGYAMEGTRSNFFIVKGDQVITTPTRKTILSGITRQAVLDIANEAGFASLESLITQEELEQADEIWLTSSTKEIYPITQLNGKPVGSGKVGDVWKKVKDIYRHHYHHI